MPLTLAEYWLIWGYSVHFPEIAYTLKTGGCRVKSIDLWDSEVQGQFESFSAIVSKYHATQKRLDIELNSLKLSIYGIFNLVVSKVFWDHSVHLS